MVKCKDCKYGVPVYKAEDIIDCCLLGKLKSPEDECEEGAQKDGGHGKA